MKLTMGWAQRDLGRRSRLTGDGILQPWSGMRLLKNANWRALCGDPEDLSPSSQQSQLSCDKDNGLRTTDRGKTAANTSEGYDQYLGRPRPRPRYGARRPFRGIESGQCTSRRMPLGEADTYTTFLGAAVDTRMEVVVLYALFF